MKIQHCIRTLPPAIVLGLLFFACTKNEAERPPTSEAPASSDVTVVATVNGDPITLGEFQERFARSGYKPDTDIGPAVKEEFLNRLIERKMMLGEAQRSVSRSVFPRSTSESRPSGRNTEKT